MDFAKKIFLVSILGFLLTASTVNAQSGAARNNFCFDGKTGQATKPNTAGGCDSGTLMFGVSATASDGTFYGICVSSTSPYTWQKPDSVNSTNGSFTCKAGFNQVSRAAIFGSAPTTGGGSTQKPPSGGGSTQKPPSGGGTTTTGGSGDVKCDSGFEKVGPTCVPVSPFSGGLAGTKDLKQLIPNILKILLTFAGVFAVIMMIIGGYQYMTAGGNATQSGNAKKTLINAIIGLIVVVFSYTIVQVVVSFITKTQ